MKNLEESWGVECYLVCCTIWPCHYIPAFLKGGKCGRCNQPPKAYTKEDYNRKFVNNE